MTQKKNPVLIKALIAALVVPLTVAFMVIGASAAPPTEVDYISITAVENSAIVDVVVPVGNLEAGQVSFLVYKNGDGFEDVEYINQYATDGALAVTFPAQEPIVVGDELLVQIGGGGLDGPVYKVFYMTNKDALQAAVDAAEDPGYNREDYTPESYAAFEDALEHAKEVLESDNYSQDEVDAAEDALLAAIEALSAYVTSIKIVTADGPVSSTVSVTRNSTLYFDILLNEGASGENLVWTVSDTSFATVDSSGTLTIKNKTGMVVLTVTDTITGVSFSTIIRIT